MPLNRKGVPREELYQMVVGLPEETDDLYEALQDLKLDKNKAFLLHVDGVLDLFERCEHDVKAGWRWQHHQITGRDDELFNICASAMKRSMSAYEKKYYLKQIKKKMDEIEFTREYGGN